MQLAEELKVMMNSTYASLAIVITFFLPIAFVIYCRSRKESEEGTICYRTTQFSNEHPISLLILEFIPSLLVIILFSHLLIDYFLVLVTVIGMICIIADAWRTKKYPL
ncbi:hypothetical protein E4H12_06950 [Candidatus Thorarchaeota archaeon]|nr:MAG: hypothetical protein E4H12_06950 [Candidatus Thorarchaeota archaeon]